MNSASARRLGLALGLAALAGAAGACPGKTDKKKIAGDAAPGAAAQAAPADDKQPPAPAPAPAGNPMGMLGTMLAAQADEPGPYDEPRASGKYDEDDPHAAILEIDEPVIELEAVSLFGGAGGGVELRALIERLRALGRDKEVTALVVRFEGSDIDFPAAEELRTALAAFRTAGDKPRPIHCHTESAENVVYYAMTACDSIALAPGGGIMVSGVAAVPIHIKGTLDRLGVQADFLHIGAFKGAAEPLTRDKPSREMVETLGAILDERFAALVDGIAAGRKMEPAAVRGLIDTAVFSADEALTARLVDKVALFEPWRDEVLAGAEWTVVKVADDQPPGIARLMEMLGLAPRKRPSDPHIALVYAVGSVVDGKGGGTVGARREIAPRTLGSALRILSRDDNVKAIVLRIDSGGGSALASEILWQTVAEAKKVKPVIVSMGGVAASGGYYIGCGASKVFASRTTLTGSIGVVGGKLAIGRGLKKIGVSAFPVGRGRRALLFSTLAPWNQDERAAVKKMMQTVYDLFVARVAEGRGKQRAEVHAVAQGRVWTGRAALEHGLVDKLGGLEDALAEARTLARLGDEVPLEVYPPPPTLMDWLGSFGAVSAPFGLDATALELARLLSPREAAAVLDLFTQLAQLEAHPVQAALFWPVLFR
jgi:protease-4